MKSSRALRLLAALCLSAGLSVFAAGLEVTGEVPNALKLSEMDLIAMPRAKVMATEHNGSKAEFEGVPVSEILKRAGVPQGEKLRGKNLALCLLVTASDGYRAVFTLPELDPLFTDNRFILADRRDGQPLDATVGPLRLVLPDEKRQTRWVRQVVRFEIIPVSASPVSSPSGRTNPPPQKP